MAHKVTKEARDAAKRQLEAAAGSLMQAGTVDMLVDDLRRTAEQMDAHPEIGAPADFKRVRRTLAKMIRAKATTAALHRYSAARAFRVAEQLEDRTSSELLLLRYRDGLGWDEVALRLGYSADYVRGDLHRKALEAYAEAPGGIPSP